MTLERFPLFVYGQLCIGMARPVRAYAEMRYLPDGSDAACRWNQDTQTIVYGQLQMKTWKQIQTIRKFERLGEPEWLLQRIDTCDFGLAYAFYYDGPYPMWDTLTPAPSGIWTPPRRAA